MQRDSPLFVFFLASISALTSLSIDMSLPAVPSIEHVFGLHAGHGGLSISLFLAGYAVTPLAGGPLADRFGRRPVLLASLACFAVASVGCAAAPTFALLIACRILQGCASGMAVALPLAIVRDLFTGHPARQRIAEVTTINGIMPIVAPMLGSFVMAVSSWHWIFLAQAVFSLGVILAVSFAFEESLSPTHRQGLHPARIAGNYATVFSDRGFLGYALMYGLNFACVFAFIATSPLILMQTMGVSRSTYTLLFGLTVTGTIAGAVTSSGLSKRGVSVRRMLSAGLILMTLASVAAASLQLLRIHRPVALLPFIFGALFCFGLTSPAITLEALEALPQLAGSGSGAMRSLQMIIGSAVSSLLAVVCALPGVSPALATTLTMAAAVLISFSLYFGSLRSRHTVPAALSATGD